MGDDGEEMPIWLHWPAAIISSIIGLIFITIIVTSTLSQISTSDWDSTTGIIEDYDYFCDHNGEETYCEEDIAYTYTIGDDIFYSDITNLGWTKIEYQWYMSLGLTNGVTFERGDEIEVYYDPYEPQNSVLIPGWDGIEFVDFFIIVIATIGPSVLLITARMKGTISEAINEFKGLAKTAKDIQRNMNDSGNTTWNHQNFQPAYGESISYSQYGISPSRMRGYESAIAYLSLNDSMDENTVKTLVKSNFGISANDAEKFVESTYVKAILFSNSTDNGGKNPSLPSTLASESISENLISEVESSSPELQSQLISNFQAAMQEAMDLQENTPAAKPSVDPNKETCSHPNCNNEVSFYSFQCFSCRKKFCDEHKGASIHCADCA